jgi:integrase
MPLTDTDTKNAKPKPDGKPAKYPDEKGMYLLVSQTGKYWRYDYRFQDKRKTLALGTYPEVSLKAAREKLAEARRLLAEGTEPSTQKKRDKIAAKVAAANTFEALAREWHEKMSSEWSTQHAARVLTSLEQHLFPSLGKLPVTEILPLELLEVLRKVENAGKHDTTIRLRERCSAIYRLAILTGRATHDPAASLLGALKTPKVEHRKALSRDELPGFLKRLDEHFPGNRQTLLLMQLMVLCFTRIGEMTSATWAEINFDDALWTIPPEHCKLKEIEKATAQPHLVPLSHQALAILQELQSFNGHRTHIFPGRNNPNQPMNAETLRRSLERLGYKGKAHIHGFRSTASTILNETGFNPDAIERQLSHVETNKVRSAYNRAEYTTTPCH